MSNITFTSEPSLQRKGSKARLLLQAAARSHAAYGSHIKRGRRRSKQTKQVARYSSVLDARCGRTSQELNTIEEESVMQPALIATTFETIHMRYSDYLEKNYARNCADHVNSLFTYCELSLLPYLKWRS